MDEHVNECGLSFKYGNDWSEVSHLGRLTYWKGTTGSLLLHLLVRLKIWIMRRERVLGARLERAAIHMHCLICHLSLLNLILASEMPSEARAQVTKSLQCDLRLRRWVTSVVVECKESGREVSQRVCGFGKVLLCPIYGSCCLTAEENNLVYNKRCGREVFVTLKPDSPFLLFQSSRPLVYVSTPQCTV